MDIGIPTLKYIHKQDLKVKDTYDLLISFPSLDTSGDLLDTVFVQKEDESQEGEDNFIKNLVV